ncbi:MAG TPA: glycoside hydrolase family 15 protein [Steroidobacteraceae bacterium]|nr:glycoside hydrolase family 15 protein [Steroidobacteraceae bacterium]
MERHRRDKSARRIADYAVIGDCETAALVDREGSIEWLCWPRFDSQACCAALLGSDENGYWRLASTGPGSRSRCYRRDSLILESRVQTADGSAKIIDFMPVRGQASDVVRIVRGERGVVRLCSDLCMRFDYGRRRPHFIGHSAQCVIATAGPHAARLAADVPLNCTADGRCKTEFAVRAGEQRVFVLTYFVSYEREPPAVDAEQALAETERFWSQWVERCSYQGPWRDAVVRSLITMKALTYRPSGGIAAAATSSLPERRGGTRNWDYRFCWLRDATFTLLAFLYSGYREEAIAWRDWLLRAVGGEAARVQPIYGMAGEARLDEWEASWLAGFDGARPVRFGNAAFSQHQLDVYGEVIDALQQAHAHGIKFSEAAWRMQLKMVEHLETVWRQPDNGIWEVRDTPRRFTYSQAMIWAALDRLIRRAESERLEAPLERWKRLRAQIHAEVCRSAFHPDRNTFVRDFDSGELDASLLLLPQIGFLPPDDARIIGTVEAIGRNLQRDGLTIRHRADGEGEADAAVFCVCSLWYADALLMIGRRDAAVATFERVLALRNDLGLLAEAFDTASRELMGNFPQALSHLALVNTALNLQGTDGPAWRRGS